MRPTQSVARHLATLIDSPARRVVAANAASLLVLQALNYLLPLVTVPYLVRVLGTDKYGLLAFIASTIAYFQFLVDYGFNLTATREIAVSAKDRQRLSRLVSNVYSTKLGLSLVSFLGLSVVVALVPKLAQETPALLWSFVGVVGSLLFPLWFFQGMERMTYITALNAGARVLVTASIFVLIRSPDDYLRVIILNSLGSWVIGALSLWIVYKRFDVSIVKPRLKECVTLLREGRQVFVSQMSVTLFTTSNTFLLGLFTNNTVVGNFAIAEKIVRAFIYLSVPITNAIYPRVSLSFKESKEKALSLLRKVLLLGTSVYGLLSVVLFVAADLLVWVVNGHGSTEIAVLVRIMAVLPLTVFLDNIFGTQILLNTKMDYAFMRAVVLSGALSLLTLLVLVPRLQAVGAATSFLIAELAVLLLTFIPVQRAGLNPLTKRE